MSHLLPHRLRGKVQALPATQAMLHRLADLATPRQIVLGDGSKWDRLQDCPKALLDPGGIQIGDRVYVIGGFTGPGTVSDSILVFDLKQRRWMPPLAIPDDLPHSHAAVATDGQEVIYLAGGQWGPQCRPAVPIVYAFNIVRSSWHRLPDLPAPRYAGTMQRWKGRLHYVGGADIDRWTARSDHWSLAVSGSEALEPTWRNEAPIPVPGMHRSSALVKDVLYVIGGQQGDFQAIPDDPDFVCTGRTRETYLSAVFRLSAPDGEWQRMADLPIAVSHCDFSRLTIDGTIYLYGGQIYKDPQDFLLRLTNAVQAYDTGTDRWSIAGYTPYHVKMPVVGRLNGHVVITVGQRGQLHSDRPGAISAWTWFTAEPAASSPQGAVPVPSVSGKRVLLVSHQLQRTGGSLELLELGAAMIESDADVRLVALGGDTAFTDVSAEFRIPVVPPETAVAHAAEADLVVINTAHPMMADWVRASLEFLPDLPSKLLWLVHEIDVDVYRQSAPTLRLARAASFDSAACRRAWEEVGGLPEVADVISPGLHNRVFETAAQARHLFVRATSQQRAEVPRLLSRDEIRAELGIRKDEVVILSIGSIEPRKGQEMLLRSVVRAARGRGLPLRLLLAGFSNEAQKREILATLDRDGRKVFDGGLGYTTTPYINALCLASDLHVLNSQGEQGRGETFGRATVHAMAFGLPVLGTQAGGMPEVFDDGVQGFLYPLGEAGQEIMIDRIASLVADPDLRLRMGKAAAAHARAWHPKDKYLTGIDTLLATRFFARRHDRV